MFVGNKIKGKFRSKVVFAPTSNQVITDSETTRIPENGVLGSKFNSVD